ncbi:hypothetical protein ACIA5D_17290 [Actinoplanes sp. NPDC051513]|uniref:hypothetical protein n=1 Tax=Actinoplanes sp. NPDC051513 TaxID=3363908 RepID=UPI0037A9C328
MADDQRAGVLGGAVGGETQRHRGGRVGSVQVGGAEVVARLLDATMPAAADRLLLAWLTNDSWRRCEAATTGALSGRRAC